MKKAMFISSLLLVGMMMFSVPADAQTRKEKKAAKKAEWQFEQQKKELERQRVLDSIQNANTRIATVHDVPCWMADDDEWFYATIQRQCKQSSMNTAPTATLRSAQMLMRQKLSGVYRAVLRDYFDQMDTDEGNYANQHLESAGDLVIKATINETYEVCRKLTRPDENGNITMYMTIKVSKKKFANDLVKKITEEEQMKVRFNEKKFRDSAFKVFEDSNNKEFNEFKESNN